MGRNVLLVTTDQQRYDSLGCNGGNVARTPTVDALAARGVNYRRAYTQNVTCTPARATILTGQLPANARRDLVRPLARGRRAVARRVPARTGRLPHRTRGQGALRPGHGPAPPVRRDAARRIGNARAAPRLRARRARDARTVRDDALRALAARAAPRGRRRLRRAPRRGRESRDGRARVPAQPRAARAVPHRLGRRPHDRVARRARSRRRPGSAGRASPTRTIRGTRRRPR